MPKALILVADGSEEIEFVTPYDGKLYGSQHLLVLSSTLTYTYDVLQFSPAPASTSHPPAYLSRTKTTHSAPPPYAHIPNPNNHNLITKYSMTRDIRIVPDYPILSSVPDPTDFDILILPGGGPGAKTFSTTDSVLELVHNFRKNYKWVAAICAGTTALVASDEKYSTGKTRVTSHPSVRGEVEGKGWEYSEERVVIDRKVVTSRG
jgi:protein DJ-1